MSSKPAEHGHESTETKGGGTVGTLIKYFREVLAMVTIGTGAINSAGGNEKAGMLLMASGAAQAAAIVTRRTGIKGSLARAIEGGADVAAGVTGGAALHTLTLPWGIGNLPWLGYAAGGALAARGAGKIVEGEAFDREHHLEELRHHLTEGKQQVVAACNQLRATIKTFKTRVANYNESADAWTVAPPNRVALARQIATLRHHLDHFQDHDSLEHQYLHHCHHDVAEANELFFNSGTYAATEDTIDNQLVSAIEGVSEAWRPASFKKNEHEDEIEFPGESTSAWRGWAAPVLKIAAPITLPIIGGIAELNSQVTKPPEPAPTPIVKPAEQEEMPRRNVLVRVRTTDTTHNFPVAFNNREVSIPINNELGERLRTKGGHVVVIPYDENGAPQGQIVLPQDAGVHALSWETIGHARCMIAVTETNDVKGNVFLAGVEQIIERPSPRK